MGLGFGTYADLLSMLLSIKYAGYVVSLYLA